MATNILTAIRRASQLRGNLKFTALEIGHRMNRSGYVTMAHQMMAWKTGSSLRTMYRHVAKLCAMGIFAKTVYRTAHGYGWNLYKCLLPLPAFYRATPATTDSDTMAGTLPEAKTGEAKERTLQEDLRRQRWAVHNLTLPPEARASCLEEIARLERIDGEVRGS